MNKTQAKLLARSTAWRHREEQSYFPPIESGGDIQSWGFEPHDWVVDAIQRAYAAGRSDGVWAKQLEIQKALGINLENLGNQ